MLCNGTIVLGCTTLIHRTIESRWWTRTRRRGKRPIMKLQSCLCSALPLFIAQLEGATANPESAASAASALWALLHRGERVKATLKGIPHAVNTIRRCQKLCDSIIEEDGGGEGAAGEVEERVAVMRQITHSTRAVLRVLGVGA